MPTGISRVGLAKAEDALIKLGCLLQIVNLDRDVNDARHVLFLLQNSTNVDVGRGIFYGEVSFCTSHSLHIIQSPRRRGLPLSGLQSAPRSNPLPPAASAAA